MQRYICAKCGMPCYSAADLEHLCNPKCDYCGGELERGCLSEHTTNQTEDKREKERQNMEKTPEENG
jgi:hypothetical protein